MLGWALLFLIMALVTAAFAFRGVNSVHSNVAKVAFFLFILLFVGLLAMSLLGQGTPAVPNVANA